MLCRFAANAPLLVQGDGIAFNVRTVQGIYCDYGNLGLRFLLELLADVVQLRDGGRIQNVGEVVDIIGRTQLGGGFCRSWFASKALWSSPKPSAKMARRRLWNPGNAGLNRGAGAA